MSLNSRRQFIKATTLGGIATTCFPFQTVLAGDMNKKKWLAPKGMRILFQGDSITDGNRGRNTDPNHIMGHGYAFSIASRLGADYPEQAYDFFNRGISGNKVIDLKERWQTDTFDLKPDVLSILVGVNDASSVVFNWEPVVSVAKFEETYRFLLEQTLEKIPGIRLVLCEPFIKAVGRVKDNWDAYYSDIIKRQEIVRNLAAEYDTLFIAFQEVFDKACDRAPADYWIWDGVHPTVAGHELMAREWIDEVTQKIKF